MIYLYIIFIIGLLILIHEAGHFIAARIAGIPIECFSIGFGPALLKHRFGMTEYRLSLVPIGGYVLPAISNENDYFLIPVNKRIIMSLGGPAANIILPLFLLAIANTIEGGVSFQGILVLPFQQTGAMITKIFMAFSGIFSRPDQVSGIVGIVTQGSAFIGGNIVKGIYFSILLSINLAIFNMLPIPALDGGKIILSLLEKIHPKLRSLHVPLSIIGWLMIAGLMIYATVLDVARIT